MSIVIQVIKGKRYAYDHFRVGTRIHAKYLYRVDEKGNRVHSEHGGGAPSEGRTPNKLPPGHRGRPKSNKPKPKSRPKREKKPEPPVIKLPEVKLPEIMPVFKKLDEGIKALEGFVNDPKDSGVTVKIRMTAANDSARRAARDLYLITKTAEAYKAYQATQRRILAGVEFEGANSAMVTSVFSGLAKTLGRYNLKIDQVGWMREARGSTAAVTITQKDFDSNKIKKMIHFNRPISRQEQKDGSSGYQLLYLAGKTNRLAAIEKRIKDIEAGIVKVYDKEKALASLAKDKLKESLTKRFTISTAGGNIDPIEQNAIHEGWHVVFQEYQLEKTWVEALKKYGIGEFSPHSARPVIIESPDAASVSEYALKNIEELFTETGSAVAAGITDYSDKIKAAWDETMKELDMKVKANPGGIQIPGRR
jgi:hypothetical protein